jgi:hypothetical protein
MSNPTDAELSRVIANHLGWRLDDRFHYWHHPDCTQPEGEGHKECGRSTLDFCSEHAMTVLLWERLLAKYDAHAFSVLERRITRLLHDGLPRREAIQRGTAEAYAIAHNLIQGAR